MCAVGIVPLDVPRAMEAVDADHPHGTTGYKNNGYTVLQQHIAFFDRNNDGVIYPWETFQGTIYISVLNFAAFCAAFGLMHRL